jgi:hypothetical protein
VERIALRCEPHQNAGCRRFTSLLRSAGISLLLGIGCLQSAAADTIFLKDGTTEQSERVWETEKFVHFILKGTKTVEIRYSKDIVERIERDGAPGDPSQNRPIQPTTPATGTEDSSLPSRATPTQAVQSTHPARDEWASSAGTKGIGFYNPHRKDKYWADPDSHHAELQSALRAIALRYDRPVDWVVAHMGEENDLAHIHGRLTARIETETKGLAGGHAEPPPAMIDPSPEVDGKVTPAEVSLRLSPVADEFKGMKFYDPRRARKYWIDNRSHFGTLQEALNALSSHYGVSAQWIAQKMGETNDLYKIHQNIRKNLPDS